MMPEHILCNRAAAAVIAAGGRGILAPFGTIQFALVDKASGLHEDPNDISARG